MQIRHQPETSRRVKVGTDFLLRRRNATTEKGRRSQPAIETSTAAEALDIHGGRERRRKKNRRRRNGASLKQHQVN